MKVVFLTRRIDHKVDHPLIEVINDVDIARAAFKVDTTREDNKWHQGWYVIAHDIETQTEWPQKKGLLLSAFCLYPEYVLVIDNTSVDNAEVFDKRFLSRCLFIAHNADFEARWGYATGFLPARYACTMVNDRRLQSGMEGYRYDLISTINRRLGLDAIPVWMDKDIRSEFADCTYFTAEQILYNAADTIRLKSLYYKQREVATETGMDFLIGTISSRIIIPIAKAEVTGIRHDAEKWRGIARDRQGKADKICQELTKIVTGEYGVDLEKVNPELLRQRLAGEKRKAKASERELKLRAQLKRLEDQGKTHLKSYQSTRLQLEKIETTLLSDTTQTQHTLSETSLINWGSQKQVVEVLKQIGCPVPQAKDAKTHKLKDGVGKLARANWFVLHAGSSYEPFMKKYDEYKKLIHNVTSFGEKWIELYTNPYTGRIHTMMDQAGTETGRFSMGSKGKIKKYPNMNQVPKPKEYRACFLADEGRSLITMDFKNQEGVIIAAQTGDLNLKKIIHLDDSHSYLGTKCWRAVYAKRGNKELAETYEMNKSTPEKNKERDEFKNAGGLFPVLYGVYASKVAAAAKVTQSEGQIFIDTIKNEVPQAVIHLDKVRKKSVTDGYVVHNARSGSRRWFQQVLDHKHYGWKLSKDAIVEIESASGNSCIQGTGSDILKECIAWLECWANIYKQDVRFFLPAHDEMVVDCPGGKEDFYLEKVSNVMRRVAKTYLIEGIDMDVDARHGKCWLK